MAIWDKTRVAYNIYFTVSSFRNSTLAMGGGNSRQNSRSAEELQQDNEKIARLSHLLSLKSEHRQIVASRGWDKTQQEMV